MMRFSKFIEQSEDMTDETKDIQTTLAKLPPSHASLVNGYHWKFHPGNTLIGDDEHVGYVDDRTKEIAVASPWNYGREFTVLHEVAHKVWERFIATNPQLFKMWHEIVRRENSQQAQQPEKPSSEALRQSPEEIFCMVYANYYTKHKVVTYHKKAFMEFIPKLPS